MSINYRYRKTLDNFTRQSIAHSAVNGRMVGLNIPRYTTPMPWGYKNLIPPLTSGKWTIHSNAVVNGNYDLTLNATGTAQSSYCKINVKPFTNYTVSLGTNTMRYAVYDGNLSTSLLLYSTGITTRTFNSGSYTSIAFCLSSDSLGAGSYSANNFQLEEGVNATSFEPAIYYPQAVYQNPGLSKVLTQDNTNILPAGSDNFKNGWSVYGGESITVTDYPCNIPGIGDVIAKRITGNGVGTSQLKYYLQSYRTYTSGEQMAGGIWGKKLNSTTSYVSFNVAGVIYPYFSNDWQELSASATTIESSTYQFQFRVANIEDILDIVVYHPQININTLVLQPYTPPAYKTFASQDVTGKMLNISEGTTNLLPVGSEDFVTGWTWYGGATGTVIGSQPDPFGTNKAYRVQTSGGTSGSKYLLPQTMSAGNYSLQVWLRVRSGSVKVMATSGNSTTVTTLDGWKLVKLENQSYSSDYPIRFVAVNIFDSLDFDVCFPQVEQKAYCTGYIPPGQTRQPEQFTIPTYGTGPVKNLLSLNQSSVEVDTSGFSIVGTGVTLSRDISEKYQGSASLKVVTPGTNANEGVYTSNVNVSPNLSYTFTIWIKGASGTVCTQLNERDASDVSVGSTTSSTTTLDGTWKKIPVTRTFGSTGVIARTHIVTTGTIQALTFYVDNLQIEQSSSATYWHPGGFPVSTNAVKNLLTENQSNIEVDISGFSVFSAGTISRDSTEKTFGQFSLKVVTPGTATYQGVYTSDIAISPGKKYAASFYIKGDLPTVMSFDIYNQGASAGLISKSFTLSTSRQRVVVPLQTSITDTALRIYIRTSQAIATTFYVDGLQLEEIQELPRNLLTDNQAGVEADTSGFGINNTGTTLSRDTSERYGGNASLKVVCDGSVASQGFVFSTTTLVSPSKTYTGSCYVKGSGTVILLITEKNGTGDTVGNTTSNIITLSSNWQRIYISRSFGTTGVGAKLIVVTPTAQAITFYSDNLQLEEGSEPTEWQAPYSGATAFCRGQVPMPVVNPNEGTIEMFVNVNDLLKNTTLNRYLLTIPNVAKSAYSLGLLHQNSGYWGLFTTDDGGSGSNAQPSDTIVTNTICKFSAKWSKDYAKVLINGTVVGSITNPKLSSMFYYLLYIGCFYSLGYYGDTCYSNIRISNVFRPDSEQADTWNTKLTKDTYTTWLTDFDQRMANVA